MIVTAVEKKYMLLFNAAAYDAAAGRKAVKRQTSWAAQAAWYPLFKRAAHIRTIIKNNNTAGELEGVVNK